MSAEVGRTGAPKLLLSLLLDVSLAWLESEVVVVGAPPGRVGQESRPQAREEGQQPPPREDGHARYPGVQVPEVGLDVEVEDVVVIVREEGGGKGSGARTLEVGLAGVVVAGEAVKLEGREEAVISGLTMTVTVEL